MIHQLVMDELLRRTQVIRDFGVTQFVGAKPAAFAAEHPDQQALRVLIQLVEGTNEGGFFGC